jgi:hypothetical protein
VSELNFVAAPRSRKEIRRWADVVRQISGFAKEPRFDIVRFVELRLPVLDDDATFALTDDLGPGIHACTDVRSRCIMIHPEIYRRAGAGYGRDRMTLAHEVGHLLLHTEVQLARRIGSAPLAPFRDPEWQAKAFAGELMIPRSLYPTEKHPAEVAALLGVSTDAVLTQFSAWKREG